MVVSFMIFVLRKAGMMSSEYDNQVSDRELAKFNSQFEIYDRKNNTFQDILTVANLAWDTNKQNSYDSSNGVVVNLQIGSTIYSVLNDENLPKNYFYEKVGATVKSNLKYFYENSFVQENTEKKSVDDLNAEYEYRFECTGITYNDITGKVKTINFERKDNS